jgi:tryptophanyl-tRNA synthetase
MSKSAGNVIALSDPPPVVANKLAGLRGDATRPDGGRLFAFVDAFVDDGARRRELLHAYRAGEASEREVQAAVVEAVETILSPIRARRAAFESDAGLVEEILVDGTLRAREVAYETLQRARAAMGLDGLWKGLMAATEKRAHARKRPR